MQCLISSIASNAEGRGPPVAFRPLTVILGLLRHQMLVLAALTTGVRPGLREQDIIIAALHGELGKLPPDP
jgi:hypothetical protein